MRESPPVLCEGSRVYLGLLSLLYSYLNLEVKNGICKNHSSGPVVVGIEACTGACHVIA